MQLEKECYESLHSGLKRRFLIAGVTGGYGVS